MPRFFPAVLSCCLVLACSPFAGPSFAGSSFGGQDARKPASPATGKRHILILAGPITGHPKNTHEYEKSAILIKHLLDRSGLKNIRTTVVFDGWPDDIGLLESADTIVMISDGGDHNESNHPLYKGTRFEQLGRQMDRGCGLVQLHWSTFNPSRYHQQITEWVGGYFDYETGKAANHWYSAIKHYTEPIRIGVPEHPVASGVKPFRLLEEFYYRIRFRENDPRLRKIVLSRPTGETGEYAVGWAVERKDGGRGFGFTGGHYYANWWDDNFRKLVLNAIVWTAGVPVPPDGVPSKLPPPTRALIVTGHNHPAHDWRTTTAALLQTVEIDPRILVDVQEDPEFLGSERLRDYDVVVMNYSSWDRKGLSATSKDNFVQYLKQGGGLAIIHFANGSWTNTLPNQQSDWPEYRTRIVRRIWEHGSGISGHDAFGNFRVRVSEAKHAITEGLGDFNTRDELYYRQKGDLEIEPLLTAKSRDTGQEEPMAWAYSYEKARVFQTVLGHADESILMAGALMRRGVAWAAGLENLSFDPPVARKTPYLWRKGAQWTPTRSLKKPANNKRPKPPKQSANPQFKKAALLVPGKFGKALDARVTGVLATAKDKRIRDPDLTVECWVKLYSKSGYNILAASETKSSLKHWELYTYAGTGYLSVYLPGIFGEIKSQADICDGKWHYVAMTYEKQFVRLYVDGKRVKEQPINYRKHPDTSEGFAIGSLVEKGIGCDGLIDELRISNSIRKISAVPQKPFQADSKTISLWHFDRLNGKKLDDDSPSGNALQTEWKPVQGKSTIQAKSAKSDRITGHWGEDAIGFRWTEKDSEDNRWAFTDHGRFLASTIPLPGGFAEKGLVIRCGENLESTVCYDLKRLNLMAAWTGGFLEFDPARFGLIRHLKPVGSMMFHNQSGLGWNSDRLRYRGLYVRGKRVLLEYSVGDAQILESPWAETFGNQVITSREFVVGPHEQELLVPLSSFPGTGQPQVTEVNNRQVVSLAIDDDRVAAGLIAGPAQARVVVRKNQIWLAFSGSEKATIARVLLWRGSKAHFEQFREQVGKSPVESIAKLKSAGERNWPKKITTDGVLGEQTALGYAVDTIRLPFQNPYRSLFFVTGHDWLPTGEILISTVHGEIWKARPLDEKRLRYEWSRFATGLYQPLGIRILKNGIFVLCRDQIVRLHDRNNDGEADYHECFHFDVTTSTGVHDYVCCLENDAQGNLYYIHANDGVIRVSPDGKHRTVVATGFRNPNGLGVRSDGLITAAPQEGEWTPASAVCEVIEGRHYGYRGPGKITPESPLGYEKPMVFLPRLVDNSSGGQVWTESDRWGVLANSLFHLSYGKCTMHMILRDRVPEEGDESNGIVQGVAVPFPFNFESGVCRGRMSPHDGQLYLSGLKGWTTTAVRDGCLQRVRYLGNRDATFCPNSYRVLANGIELGFTSPLDPESITSTSFQVQAWNYRYSKNYGSPEFRITNPNQQGRDRWLVQSVRLSDGNRKAFLEIPELRAVDQVAISVDVRGPAGAYDNTIYGTIRKVHNRLGQPGKPFDRSLVEFEKKLTPGVFVKSHHWTSKTLDLFDPKVEFLEKQRIKNGIDPSRGYSLVTYLKIEAPGTTLTVTTGKRTSCRFRVSELDSQLVVSRRQNGSVGVNAAGTIPITIDRGYCRFEVDLLAQNGDLQCRWNWKSRDFPNEPIPPDSLFQDRSWIEESHSDFASRFLEAGQLLLENRCTRCHDFGQSGTATDYRLQRTAPDLIDLKSRRTTGYLLRKILEPRFENNGATMPEMIHGDPDTAERAAKDLVAYLTSLGPANTNSQAHSDDEQVLQTGEKLFEQLGCIGCHQSGDEEEPDRFDRISLDFSAAKFTKSGLRHFLLDPRKHSPFGRMGDFSLTNDEAHALASLIENFPGKKLETPNLSDASIERGRELFAASGCANCHRINDSLKPMSIPVQRVTQGCLAEEPESDSNVSVPGFPMDTDQKQLLSYYLNEFQSNGSFTRATIDEALSSQPPLRQVDELTRELRCFTCHDSGQRKASLPEIVLNEGTTGLNPERLPGLGQVGHKLLPQWMDKFLQTGVDPRPRPWLHTRMPRFGSYSTTLANGLTHQAGYDANERQTVFKPQPELAKVGKELIGNRIGLDCRQCHGVGDLPPTGDDKTQIVLGIKFSMVGNRIRREYYDRWMLNPLRIDPQTKMPRYAIDGKLTKIKEVFAGDAARQFEALWHFLQSVKR